MTTNSPSKPAKPLASDQAPDSIHRDLGSRLKHLRAARGWSLEALAHASGVSRSMLSQIEREQANPHLLEQLRQVLPGLARLVIRFEADNQPRPEDALRADPNFQRLLADVGGEIVTIRRADAT